MDRETRDELHALRMLGNKAAREGRYGPAINYYKEVLRILPDDFETLVILGDLCSRAGDRKDQGIAYYDRALRIQPGNRQVIQKRDWLYQERVRVWHFRMMNDEERNQCFYRAIKRAVTPDSIVLDIGTGSGLLALMAVEAGARHVYTVEVNGTIGNVAREIIAAHGMSDRITVLSPYYSTEVRLGVELPERADVMTAELLGNDTLAENMVAISADARRRLLTRDATLIPCSATAFGLLVESVEAYKLGVVDKVSGFDLSPFNRLLGGRDYGDLLSNYSHRVLSEPFELFHFDFTTGEILPEDKVIEVTPTESGTCHLVVKWQRIHTDAENHIDTWKPVDPPECPAWLQKFQFCTPPLEVTKGKPVQVHAEHDTNAIRVSLLPGRSSQDELEAFRVHIPGTP